MPEVKFTSVVSFSSEDKKFPVDNLLKPEGTAKWKSAAPGEKSVSVILQLEKPSQIHQIDIGNEGSAFIEVLVGKATQKEDEYQVILVASSFMNFQESRAGTNSTRVRIFHADQLSQAVKSDRWDRVKVVCTQPFNKINAYGLSFLKLHSPPNKDDAGSSSSETPKTQKKMGAFTLKSEDDDGIQTGTLFAKKKTEPSPSPLTSAAAARKASRFAADSSGSPGSNNSTPVRPKPSTPTIKVTPSSSRKRSNESDGEDTPSSDRPKPKIKRSATESSTSSTTSEKPVVMKKSSTEPARVSSSRELSKLMKTVVFVMSGYQNPARAEIRDEALEMGATYRTDWGKGCTHLVCAFPNTPKYLQVKGKGRIVSADWIRKSYKRKELLPWRKYRVGKAETPPGSSGSDTEDEPMSSQLSRTPSQSKTPVQKDREKEAKKEETKKEENKKEREPPKKKKTTGYTGKGVQFSDESGEDTDDEIDRVRAQNKNKASTSPAAAAAAADPDPYDISTDDEGGSNGKDVANGNDDDETDDDGELPPLPDYFKQKHFFLQGKFSSADRRMLVRYIMAYNGVLEDYMSETVKYVITDSKWDDAFDEAVSENPDLVFVKPDWVKNVHEKKKFVPYQKFVIVPE